MDRRGSGGPVRGDRGGEGTLQNGWAPGAPSTGPPAPPPRGRAPSTEAAAAFGYSRPAYYAAAAALESSGLDGLVPARPGPRGASKLTEEILAWAEEQLAADPALRPAQLPDRIQGTFGARVHP